MIGDLRWSSFVPEGLKKKITPEKKSSEQTGNLRQPFNWKLELSLTPTECICSVDLRLAFCEQTINPSEKT